MTEKTKRLQSRENDEEYFFITFKMVKVKIQKKKCLTR